MSARWRNVIAAAGIVTVIVVAAAGLRAGHSAPPQRAADAATAQMALWRSLFARPVPAEGASRVDATPADRTATPARAALGATLFSDRRLSGPGDRSCASCHRPDRAFTDGLPRAAGRSGPLARNTPTLWNVGAAKRLNWDGGVDSLAAQARRPVEHREELAGSLPDAARRLAADAALRARFAEAFGDDGPAVTPDRIIAALVAFERTLISPPTRFDRWVAGDDAALDAQELRGFDLFVGRGRCATCHAGWRFTDDRLHDVGRPAREQPGWLVEVRTPTLRELIHTAPYMHDGALASLADVVRHYGRHVVRRGTLSPNIAQGLALDDDEVAALVAFLRSLSSEP